MREYSFPRICPCCYSRGFGLLRSISISVRKRELNTRYENKDSNYLVSCLGCYIETIDYYKDLWDEYYGGLL